MLEEKWEKEIPTPGLSAEELSIARADLEVSCAPREFFQKLEFLAKRIPSEDLFNAPGFGFVLDAMILADIAVGCEPIGISTLMKSGYISPHIQACMPPID
jgi:hypothetical protein